MSLEEDVNSIITDAKIKFKTHKLRKAFIAKIATLVAPTKVVEEVVAPVTPEVTPVVPVVVVPEAKPISRREQQNAVNKLVEGAKSTGHAIMTKGMSEKNDDINKAFQDKKKVANSW